MNCFKTFFYKYCEITNILNIKIISFYNLTIIYSTLNYHNLYYFTMST
jgi:hypothetical protein